MPCNSRKDLVSGYKKYSTGLASEIWEKAPPCTVSVKSRAEWCTQNNSNISNKILPLLEHICMLEPLVLSSVQFS